MKFLKDFFDDLASKGYNTVIDMNDVLFAELSLIVFNRNKSLQKVSDRVITQKEKEEAQYILEKLEQWMR